MHPEPLSSPIIPCYLQLGKGYAFWFCFLYYKFPNPVYWSNVKTWHLHIDNQKHWKKNYAGETFLQLQSLTPNHFDMTWIRENCIFFGAQKLKNSKWRVSSMSWNSIKCQKFCLLIFQKNLVIVSCWGGWKIYSSGV